MAAAATAAARAAAANVRRVDPGVPPSARSGPGPLFEVGRISQARPIPQPRPLPRARRPRADDGTKIDAKVGLREQAKLDGAQRPWLREHGAASVLHASDKRT